MSLSTIFRLFSGGGQARTGRRRSRYRVRLKQKGGRQRPRTRSSNTSELKYISLQNCYLAVTLSVSFLFHICLFLPIEN